MKFHPQWARSEKCQHPFELAELEHIRQLAKSDSQLTKLTFSLGKNGIPIKKSRFRTFSCTMAFILTISELFGDSPKDFAIPRTGVSKALHQHGGGGVKISRKC